MNDLKGKKLLWLDDEIDRLRFDTDYLEEIGIKVFEAPLTSIALDILQKQPIDIIFTDNQLMSDQPLESYDINGGMKFVKCLRSGDANKLTNKQGLEKLPIVIISSYYHSVQPEENLYCFCKPIDIEELIDLLKQLLK